MLGRDTAWHQGSLVTHPSAVALGLLGVDDARIAIVVTHDCDLAHDGNQEAYVEVVLADSIPVLGGNFTSAKNPRRLHIELDGDGGTKLLLELRHADKQCVHRNRFAEIAEIDERFRPSEPTKRTLKQWLAARYGRPAFPNALEERLRKQSGSRTVEQHIARLLESEGRLLLGLFFDLGDQRGKDLDDGDPYILTILVVYNSVEGGPEVRESAEDVARSLSQLFERVFGTAMEATEIALERCEAVADLSISLSDIRRLDQWRLEHISLAPDDGQQFVPVGEMPA